MMLFSQWELTMLVVGVALATGLVVTAWKGEGGVGKGSCRVEDQNEEKRPRNILPRPYVVRRGSGKALPQPYVAGKAKTYFVEQPYRMHMTQKYVDRCPYVKKDRSVRS